MCNQLIQCWRQNWVHNLDWDTSSIHVSKYGAVDSWPQTPEDIPEPAMAEFSVKSFSLFMWWRVYEACSQIWLADIQVTAHNKVIFDGIYSSWTLHYTNLGVKCSVLFKCIWKTRCKTFVAVMLDNIMFSVCSQLGIRWQSLVELLVRTLLERLTLHAEQRI